MIKFKTSLTNNLVNCSVAGVSSVLLTTDKMVLKEEKF